MEFRSIITERLSASLPGFTEFLSCVRSQLTGVRGTLIDFIVVLCRRDYLVGKQRKHAKEIPKPDITCDDNAH